MNKQIILLICIFLTGNLLFAQDKNVFIQNIRSKYTKTQNNLKDYYKTSIEITGESAEGGQATAYYHNDSLELIEIIWLGETGKRQLEYYLDNGKLIFAFDQNFEYNRPIYLDKQTAKEQGDDEFFDPKKTKIKENRYYFNQEKLFRWLNNNNKEQDLTTELSTNIENELITHCHKMINQFKK